MMKGIYALIIKLDENKKIRIGRLGPTHFKKGYYVYIGSALASLQGRINRHLRKEKKVRWHIDYLLNEAQIIEILFFETEQKLECYYSKKIRKNLDVIKNFGSSDCSCEGHLFYSKENPAHLLEDFSSFSAP
jgi:sugar fermentation stimulation protein A